MNAYRRVTFEDRCQISALLREEVGVTEIARSLGFHKSTISREVKRNGGRKIYHQRSAQERAVTQFFQCRRKKVVQRPLAEKITMAMGWSWSPEQVAGRMKYELGPSVSHQTIYNFANENREDKRVMMGIRRPEKKKGIKRGTKQPRQPWMLPISARPKEANERKQIGHWERDTMYAKNRRQLLVFTDRASRYVLIKIVKLPASLHMIDCVKECITEARTVRTITNDNGSEFFDGDYLDLPIYFCDARSPQQRGTIENTIGLIRQYIKRSTDLDRLSEGDVKRIQDALNLRPRKCLDWKTPHEVFFNETVALVS